MKNWKQILATVGVATLLTSNLGTAVQTAYGAEVTGEVQQSQQAEETDPAADTPAEPAPENETVDEGVIDGSDADGAADGEAADEKIADEKVADGQTTEGEQAGDESADSKAAEDPVVDGETSDGKTADDEKPDSATADDQTSGDAVVKDKATSDQTTDATEGKKDGTGTKEAEQAEAPVLVTEETVQTAETDSYQVTVNYDADSQLPVDAQLSVTEYGPDTETYQELCEQTGESYDWLLDISFYYEDQEIEPAAPIRIKVTEQVTAEGAVEEKADDADENGISLASLDDEDEAETTDAAESAYHVENVALEDTITTITHFAESGTEVLEEQEIEVAENEEGQVETTFSLDSLSLVAGQIYHPATVISQSDFTSGGTFLIYTVEDDNVYFLASLQGSDGNWNANTFRVSLSDLKFKDTENAVDLGSTIYFQKGQTISGNVITSSDSDGYAATANWNSLCWTYNGTSLTNVDSGKRLGINSSQIYVGDVSAKIVAVQGAEDKYLQLSQTKKDDTYTLRFSSGNYFQGSTSSDSGVDVTVAKVGTDYTEVDPGDSGTASGGGVAVQTGSVTELSLGFYSVTYDGDGKLTSLDGVTYTVYDENNNIKGRLITKGGSMRLDVDPDELGLESGQSYKVKMTGVPDGYVCDGDTWTFTYTGEGQKTLGLHLEGSSNNVGIIVVNPESNLPYDKTAQVVDYVNRTYQIDLSAKSNVKKATVSGLNIHFVVDQSNSMLFPASLDATDITMEVKGTSNTEIKVQNESDLENKLEKDQVYYFITQQSTSSTVYALYWLADKDSEGNDKGTGHWAYQDASYYAKAYWKGQTDKVNTNDKISYPGKSDYDSSNTVHGGYLTGNMAGSSVQSDLGGKGKFNGKTETYTLYTTSDPYNRLHYLEQSLSEMLQLLAAVSPETKVTLDLFTKKQDSNKNDLDEVNSCEKKENLHETELNELLKSVGNITTDGGTRQDEALAHAYKEHAEDGGYIVLITDGAPDTGSSGKTGSAVADVGTADAVSTDNTVYKRVNYWAKQIKDKGATLATVGLGIRNVESGSISMRYISSDYSFTSDDFEKAKNVNLNTTSHGNWWYQPENGSELAQILCNNILSQIAEFEDADDQTGTIVDTISDSFYPINKKDNKPLESGTWITKDGTVTTSDASDAAGQVLFDQNKGWYVEWQDKNLSGNGWTGRIYVKAKEDFIGGNGIRTNKSGSATLTLADGSVYEYPEPNVNVRLLDINEFVSQVTVPKGGTINGDDITADNTAVGTTPLDSLKAHYDKIAFTKLVSGTDDTTNKVDAGTATIPVGDKDFSLKYAFGRDLTPDEWTTLTTPDASGNAQAVVIPYTYDDSEGAVGAFTITLEKVACDPVNNVTQTPTWGSHTATVAKDKPNGQNISTHSPYGDNWIEKYTLKVVYTAYALDTNGRPDQNEHNGNTIDTNGSGSPGYEVGRAGATSVQDGLGTLDSTNLHYVYAYETYELPQTGGRGTTLLYICGILMIVAAGVIVLARKRSVGEGGIE